MGSTDSATDVDDWLSENKSSFLIRVFLYCSWLGLGHARVARHPRGGRCFVYRSKMWRITVKSTHWCSCTCFFQYVSGWRCLLAMRKLTHCFFWVYTVMKTSSCRNLYHQFTSCTRDAVSIVCNQYTPAYHLFDHQPTQIGTAQLTRTTPGTDWYAVTPL